MSKPNNHTDLGDVLIRSDLNVPMINNEITDKFRISKSINIINSIYESSRTITFSSHLGRPNNNDQNFSLIKKSLLPCIRKVSGPLVVNFKSSDFMLFIKLVS